MAVVAEASKTAALALNEGRPTREGLKESTETPDMSRVLLTVPRAL